jgi:hypothetical protein
VEGYNPKRVIRPTVHKLGALLLFLALTIVMNWPQARHLTTHVHNSDDPLLSIWRLAWIAHILPLHPSEILNGNIFYPEARTLGYSDAVLLQGVAAAPFLWAGVSAIAVYNGLLLSSIALSGWAMWLYAARLTRSRPAAVVAGVIYAFVPYRFDHFMHLELQATFFLPLALLAVERLIETRSHRDAALLMAAVVGEVYSGIYYAVFLVTALALIVPFRMTYLDSGARAKVVKALLPASLVAALVVAPYLLVYLSNRATLGERRDPDIASFSASPENYLATTPDNVVHGEWSAGFGTSERRLFPGVVAILLTIAGVRSLDRRRGTLLICGSVGLIVSLGLNTPIYEWIRDVIVPYRGLRAPARASILVFLAIAGLAAYGYARLAHGRSKLLGTLGAILTTVLLLAEYRTSLRDWLILPSQPPQVYQWLAAQPRLVVAEVPFAEPTGLHRIYDGLYMFNSTYHWQPLVNGYSGFFPRSFMELAHEMTNFPDDRSIAFLKNRGVDIIIVHGPLLGTARYGAITEALIQHPDIEATVQFDEPGGTDMAFRIRR